MDDSERRVDDPPHFNPRTVRRDPVEITLTRDDLATALSISRRRAVAWASLAAILTAILVSAISGIITAGVVTTTVTRDVGHASRRNCSRTNRIAPAVKSLKEFLDSDAAYARQLAALDKASASVNADLAAQVAKLGHVIPARIAHDFEQASAISVQLGQLRAASAQLWAGPSVKRPGHRRTSSLAAKIQLLGQTACDQILAP